MRLQIAALAMFSVSATLYGVDGSYISCGCVVAAVIGQFLSIHCALKDKSL